MLRKALGDFMKGLDFATMAPQSSAAIQGKGGEQESDDGDEENSSEEEESDEEDDDDEEEESDEEDQDDSVDASKATVQSKGQRPESSKAVPLASAAPSKAKAEQASVDPQLSSGTVSHHSSTFICHH